MKTYTKGKAIKLTDNFSSTEFDCKCGKYCNKTLIDSKLVKYLQLIREHFGQPITINSGYRCAVHNKNVGGAKKSNHVLGKAADIVVKGVEPKEVAKYAESIGVKGIGVYKTFTHIDTRANKYFWYDGGKSNVSTFGGNSPSNSPANTELATVSKITVSLPTLYPGDKNKFVGVLQALLGIAADGVYGNDTERAVKEYQKKQGLKQDGIVGANTWKALFS